MKKIEVCESYWEKSLSNNWSLLNKVYKTSGSRNFWYRLTSV